MAAVIWAVAGFALIAAEALSGDFVLLMLGVAALVAALATVLGAPEWVAALVFAAAAFVLVIGVRPAIKRHLMRLPGVPSNVEALIGASGVAESEVDADGGQVRIGSELWSARAGRSHVPIHAGERVVVQRIDGAIAVVDRG